MEEERNYGNQESKTLKYLLYQKRAKNNLKTE